VADERLAKQISFLIEADQLKQVLRRTPIVDRTRQENSAEHSWHMILAAMIVREYAADVDLLRALEMIAVHDLVEIDAGDTFAYDVSAQEGKELREGQAAERIFGLLPPDQMERVRQLWEEFESQTTPESRFANAVDRLQPLLQNAFAGGGSWSTHHVTRDQVMHRMAPIETAMPALWPFVVALIDHFCASGVIRS
jgi:putative hydrolase of HD superfamily